MPRPIHDLKQPQVAPSAGDLGQEAYQTQALDQPGVENLADGLDRGTVRHWEAPKTKNPPPGQKHKRGPTAMLGSDPK